MDKKTLNALQRSITKWEINASIADLADAKVTVSDCPLCQLYFHITACAGCPVSARTGIPGCAHTPYTKATVALAESDLTAFHKTSREEVAFLKSLLPTGATTDV